MPKPLAIDLFCGLGGWADGFLLEGYGVVGFDIERHDYGTGGYPGQLVLQDVLTLHGSQFRDVENVRGAQPWVGTAKARYGAFYLWGDVPAILPEGAPKKNAGHSMTGAWQANPWRNTSSKDPRRKAFSAIAAKIPLPLSRHIARVFKPVSQVLASTIALRASWAIRNQF